MAQQKNRNRRLRQKYIDTHTGGKDKVALARRFANRAVESLSNFNQEDFRYFKQDILLFKLLCSMALPSCMMADRSIEIKKGYDKETGEVHIENRRNKKEKKVEEKVEKVEEPKAETIESQATNG